MDDQQKSDLVDELMGRLEDRGAVHGATLLELMQLEQHLQDSLGTVRRLIARHVQAVGADDAR